MPIKRDMLTQPFPKQAIRQREAVRGGKKLDYVEGHTVIHRLNDATENTWEFAIRDLHTSVIGKDREGHDIVLVRAHVALTLPGLGTREHIGVQSVRANAGEDLVKGAVTDALKKAATLFGVGLELYGPDYESGELAASQTVATSQTKAQTPSDDASAAKGPAKGQTTSQSLNAPQSGNGGRSGGSRGRAMTEKQRNFLIGLAKERGMVILGPDGDDHHNERAMDAECRQRYQTEFGGLSAQQASELIEDWKGELVGNRKPEPETEPGELTDWSGFWHKMRALGFAKREKLEAELGFSIGNMTPQEALDSVDSVLNPQPPAPA